MNKKDHRNKQNFDLFELIQCKKNKQKIMCMQIQKYYPSNKLGITQKTLKEMQFQHNFFSEKYLHSHNKINLGELFQTFNF